MTIIIYMYIMLTILENAFSSTNSIFTRTLRAELEKLKLKQAWGAAWGGDSQGLTVSWPHQGYLMLGPTSSASQAPKYDLSARPEGPLLWGDSR